jgi:hypothetical protein
MQVILVETSANNIAMPRGQVTLVLLDTSSTTIESSLKRLDLNNYLKSNSRGSNVSFEVYGGHGVTKEQIINIQRKNNNLQKQNGVIKLGPIQTGIVPLVAGAFQVDMNNDPGNKSLYLQECNILAPTITGSYEDKYAYFGNNVTTNINYFLQSGQIYANNQTRLIWADTGTQYNVNSFNMTYHAGDTYTHSIYYYGQIYFGYTEWMMSCLDNGTSEYGYHVETYALGTTIGAGINTSVFFENYNTQSNWSQGFSSSTVQASNAYDGGSPIVTWSSDTLYNNIYQAMSGSLANYGTTRWTLINIPLGN